MKDLYQNLGVHIGLLWGKEQNNVLLFGSLLYILHAVKSMHVVLCKLDRNNSRNFKNNHFQKQICFDNGSSAFFCDDIYSITIHKSVRSISNVVATVSAASRLFAYLYCCCGVCCCCHCRRCRSIILASHNVSFLIFFQRERFDNGGGISLVSFIFVATLLSVF